MGLAVDCGTLGVALGFGPDSREGAGTTPVMAIPGLPVLRCTSPSSLFGGTFPPERRGGGGCTLEGCTIRSGKHLYTHGKWIWTPTDVLRQLMIQSGGKLILLNIEGSNCHSAEE